MRKWLLHLSVSGGILGLLFWRARVWQLGDVFQDFEVWAGVAVLALNVPILLIITLRSWLVLRRIRGDVSFRGLIPIAAVGNIAGASTPANAGDLWRAYAYKRGYGVPVSQGAAAVVYERAMSFYLTALAAGGFAIYGFWLSQAGVVTAPAIGLCVMALAFAPSLLYPLIRALTRKATSGDRARRLIDRAPFGGFRSAFQEGEHTLATLFRDKALAFAVLGVTGLYLAVSAVQVWLIIAALNLGLGLHQAWLVLGVSTIIGAASSLPLGLGAADSSFVLLLGTYDVALGPATTVAVLIRAFVTLPLGLVAVAAYLYLSRTVGREREAKLGQFGSQV